jgi:hypothetical protein
MGDYSGLETALLVVAAFETLLGSLLRDEFDSSTLLGNDDRYAWLRVLGSVVSQASW